MLRHLASECVGKDARTAPQHNFCNRLDVIGFLATFRFLSYASENSVLGLWDCRFTEEKPDLKKWLFPRLRESSAGTARQGPWGLMCWGVRGVLRKERRTLFDLS